MEQFAAEGRVTPQTMVRQGETGAWAPAGQMLGVPLGPASAGGYPAGGFPPPGPMGYAPPPRSSRSTWIILAVVGGACLLLLVLCLGLPLLLWWSASGSLDRAVPVAPKVQVEELRQEVEQKAQEGVRDSENKRKEIEAKGRWLRDEPAVKPDAAKPPVEAEPEPR
jgi:hypothetical protein